MIKQQIDLFPNEMWVTNVQVATVWTSPESARDVDTAGVTTPTNIDKWIANLTHEEKLALCDENRVQSQLLYGEPVLIDEIKEEWARVVIPSQPSNKDERGYPGWVPLKQLTQVKKEEWESELTAAVISDKAWLTSDKGEELMKLSYMTFLPIEEVQEDRIKVKTPVGSGYIHASSIKIFTTSLGIEQGTGKAIVEAGEPFLELSYFWGGMSSFGYDCSGLAYATHKANGYQIPRDASDQAASGKKVAFNELLPGDLIFFAYEEGKGKLHHVGIYYGNGKMLHSPQTGRGIEIINLEGTKYEKELCAACRYWHENKE
ncbi:peptidase [Virgibacillus halodenitrificans]|uniref:Peptidase n=1 Tax=Virgibacillus halodenitrificans TaxID=1482 RepID=A0AAC9J505_VIRHA|nr:C40 family peptidase [Virgibacillus halodenitrificans]APC49730.1 peptidase [Virgibacillus halodenitrificans]MBD1221461.1 C40 family peptidase [Virgibacillus halodenitrificans]MYL45435.1 peptidase [Virgibacillus halodenitrificans]